MTPTGDPLTELATRLAALSHGDAAAIRHGLAADPDRAHLVVGQAVLDCGRRGNGSWPPAAVRPGGWSWSSTSSKRSSPWPPAATTPASRRSSPPCARQRRQPSGPRGEPPAVVVIAVRGDFWARCAAHAGLARLMQDGMFVVGPMTGPELREAITGPAAAAGLQVDADLADTVLADLRTAGQDEAEGILPLLSQAMMLTWRKRDGNRLTVRGYHETGGVARSVEFGAEAVYEALPDAGQQIAREIFQALVLVGPDGQLGSPRRAPGRAGRGPARCRPAHGGHRARGLRQQPPAGPGRRHGSDRARRAAARVAQAARLARQRAGQLDPLRAAPGGRRQNGPGTGGTLSFLYRGSQLAAVEQAAAQWAADRARYPALTGDQSGFLAASRQQAARSARDPRASPC